MNDLLPCPLCGSSELKLYTTNGTGSYRRATIKCLNCFMQVSRDGGGFCDFPKDMDYATKRIQSNENAKKAVKELWNSRA